MYNFFPHKIKIKIIYQKITFQICQISFSNKNSVTWTNLIIKCIDS